MRTVKTTQEQNAGQIRDMISTYITSRYIGREIDAMQASIAMQSDWGICLDWHEFSAVLDWMRSYGGAQISQAGGMTKYTIPYPRMK